MSTPIIQPRKVYLSRSRIESFNHCPRRGWYEYMFHGRGLRTNPGPVYYDTGNAIHAGLGKCLQLIKDGMKEPTKDGIVQVMTAVFKEFRRSQGEHNLETLGEHLKKLELDYREEQRDLASAICYAWIIQEWVPFAQRFEVLAVEMDTTFTNQIGDVQLIWESRADGIVRELLPPHYVKVISWKSARDTSKWTREQYWSDLQGYLETWFASQHTGLVVDHNQVIYLVKGKKLRIGVNGVELPWDAPLQEIVRYSTDSFLLVPYVKPDDAPNPFFNELEGVVNNTIWQPGYTRPGNVSRTYFKGWTRPDRWRLDDLDGEGYPMVFRWIDSLKANQVFPTYEFLQGDTGPLSQVVVWENESARNEGLTQELIKEISYRTHDYATTRDPDTTFHRNLKACHSGPPDAQGRIGCPFRSICQGPGAIAPSLIWPDNVPPNGFVWRKPHHAAEAVAFRPLEGEL